MEISSETIKKLDHEIVEIRVRSLKHIEGKILRAFKQNETIRFDCINLIKQLIRWFGRIPLCEEETVLSLMLTIFQSEYIHDISKFFGTDRLKKELCKVEEIVKTSMGSKYLVKSILEIIDTYVPVIDLDDMDNEIVSIESNCTIDMRTLTEVIGDDEFSLDYEKPWSTVSTRDYNTLKSLNDSLTPTSKYEELSHAFDYLKTAISDYPAEYFLQPPYIFKTLIHLYTSNKKESCRIFEKLSYLTRSILARVKTRSFSETYHINIAENPLLNAKTQITIGRFCLEILKMSVEHLKDFNDNIKPEEINLVFNLLFEVINLIEADIDLSIPIKSILIDLSYLAKNLRLKNMENMNRFNRLQYILTVCVITNLLQLKLPLYDSNTTGKNSSYNAALYSSMNERNDKDIWWIELENALLDFPLSQFHHEQYEIIKNVLQLNHCNERFNILLNCDHELMSAIKVLRQPEIYADEEFIILSYQALNTLSIHKSLEFVQKLIRTISKCIPLYDGNIKLKTVSEKILLTLLAHESKHVKRLVYKECSNCMKTYFGSLMSGENTISRLQNKEFKRAKTFGIPFTTEIILEIICFGCQNKDVNIMAELMLSLIIKSRNLLTEENWLDIFEILLPNYPLLPCLCSKFNDLGKLILSIHEPDRYNSVHNLIKDNLRFLYCSEPNIRTEAFTRLIYILSQDRSELLPNVMEISDTLPNDICIVTVPRDPKKILCGTGPYDHSTVQALMQLLKSDDVQPSIRKTTFMQLNILCQNEKLNEMISNDYGWFYAIKALENSLKKNSCIDDPETAIPALGMLSKILLCNQTLRKELAEEGNFYLLLIRTLLIFYQDIALQEDCSLALFLLLFSNYITGTGTNISIPKLFDNLKLPLRCKYHWETSPYTIKSNFEKIFIEMCDNQEKNEGIQQYIRIKFASLWFNDLDTIIAKSEATATYDIKSVIDYSLIPYDQIADNDTDEGSINVLDTTYEFNGMLKLTTTDLRIIRYTSLTNNLKNYLRAIKNATEANNYIDAISSIQIILKLSSYDEKFRNDILVHVLRPHLLAQPTTDIELILFEYTLKLFTTFIRLKNYEVHEWLLEQIQNDKHCTLIALFKNFKLPSSIYGSLCEFFKESIKLVSEYNRTDDDNVKYTKLYTDLFEYFLPIMEESFHKRELTIVRCLANILMCLAESNLVEMDGGFLELITKKLFYFMTTLKSFSQGGSTINKNCLLIVCFLSQNFNEFVLEENQIKFLSGLCSHPDYEIRSLSWCLLSKTAENLKGATLIVRELSFLPGGFHACCLSTLLDSREVGVVRSTAGGLFSILLTHTEKDRLHVAVAPLCIEQEPNDYNDGVELIRKIFNKHRFYAEMLDSLEYFHISEIVENHLLKEVTTCEIVRTYCSILCNFIELDINVKSELIDEPVLIKIFNLIRIVPSCISESSLKMSSEICNLMIRFLDSENSILQKFLKYDQGFIVVLMHLLNMNYYDNIDKTVIINIMNVLRSFAQDSNAYLLICEIFSCNSSSGVIELLFSGISCQQNSEFQNCCLKFYITLMVKSELDNLNFDTIPKIFDSTKFIQTIGDHYEKDNQCNAELSGSMFASEIIMLKLIQLFDQIFSSKTKSYVSKKMIICEAIAITLKTSRVARLLADQKNFFAKILNKLKLLFDSISMSCSDFIRKYGDSKKELIIQELLIIYGIILNWFSTTSLTNEQDILEFSKICITTWPWITHSENFRQVFINTLAFVSEDSLQVCKQFSTPITNYQNSIIQLTGKLAIAETNKVKHPNIDFTALELLLKVLTNCCSCIEGRLQIEKLNVLEVFNLFHPSVTKSQKTWNIIQIHWLQFWEIYSRHPEGAVLRHLILLCTLVERTNNSNVRALCLSVLRNMAFQKNNVTALLSSQDFVNILKYVLSDGNSYERLIVCTTLWKLIGDNYKAKYTIKNTSIPNKLKHIAANEQECNDLNNIIDIILQILNSD